MLDIKFIRENTDLVQQALKARATEVDLDGLLKLDHDRRAVITEAEDLKTERNAASKRSADS